LKKCPFYAIIIVSASFELITQNEKTTPDRPADTTIFRDYNGSNIMSKVSEHQLLLPIINEPKAPFCKCGCGLFTEWSKAHKRFSLFIHGHNTKLQWLDPAFRENMSKRAKETWLDPAFRENMSKRTKEQWLNPAHRENISKQMKETWLNPAFRENQSKRTKEQMLKQWLNPAFRENISKQSKEQMLKQWLNPAHREKMSKQTKEQWLDPEYRAKVLKAISQSPNKPETILNQLTPTEVRYVGNRSWWCRIKLLVDGEYVTKSKNPDFKITGQKKVIELYGNFWHKNDNPEDLINAYKAIGYDCLVIWESEIYNELELTIERISQFMDKPSWQMTLL
jgi:G:T-mismatch repair DNA endonuclease (very short patch repair protein)